MENAEMKTTDILNLLDLLFFLLTPHISWCSPRLSNWFMIIQKLVLRIPSNVLGSHICWEPSTSSSKIFEIFVRSGSMCVRVNKFFYTLNLLQYMLSLWDFIASIFVSPVKKAPALGIVGNVFVKL